MLDDKKQPMCEYSCIFEGNCSIQAHVVRRRTRTVLGTATTDGWNEFDDRWERASDRPPIKTSNSLRTQLQS
jgi:hypothetical protein